MILDKEVEMKVIGKTLLYYKNLGYLNAVKNEKLIISVNHLSKGSNIVLNVECDICEKEKQISYVKYIQNTKNLTEPYCCCEKCAIEKRKNTNLERYGDKNYVNLEKMKQTNLERHGYENYRNIEKTKQTTMKNHGVEFALQSKKIRDKIKETNFNNCGFEYIVQSKTFKEKSKITKKKLYRDENYNNREQSKITCLEKYGFENTMQNKDVQEKFKQTMIKTYGVEYAMQNYDLWKKQQKSSCQVFQYKGTNLYYQGLSEFFFLEQMNEKGLLNEIFEGKKYNYILNEKFHIYYSDFLFRGMTIEIKSMWTYNKDGIDLKLQLENDTKWKTVKENGDNLIVLFSKNEIKEFVENL